MGYRTRVIVLLTGLAIVLAFAGIQLYNSKNTEHNSSETSSMSIEKVGRGEVLLTLKTSGVVESDKDILLRSPERSIVKRVAVDAGSQVKKGDLLVELEEKAISQEIERVNQQLEIKRNALKKYQLNEENTRLSLKQSEDIKKNRLELLKTSLMQQEKALKDGGVDADRVERTRNEVEFAENDLQNLIDKDSIRLKQMKADENGLILQISSQENDLNEKQRLLQKLSLTAPESGVILEVPVQKGDRVESEQMLIRMSDFSTFKIVGWANVAQNALVATGDPATVLLNGQELTGRVGEITQMYDDQMFRFDIHLDNKQQNGLEVNTSVAVEVISSQRNNVLRIKKPEGLENTTHLTVYRVKGNEKIKADVILGTIGNEWCEVVSGLNEGDEIMIPVSYIENNTETASETSGIK